MEIIKFDRMKNWANIQKHGMSLFTAANVLHNPNALIENDEIRSAEEELLHSAWLEKLTEGLFFWYILCVGIP